MAFVDTTTLVGLMAAFCTTVSYYPQLKKCWVTGSADDLSFKMFITLAAGVALWAAAKVRARRNAAIEKAEAAIEDARP
jgi:uncharacterized protein with PQ loop repeat